MTYIQSETGTFDPRVTQTKTILGTGRSTPVHKSHRSSTREEREYRQCVEAGIPAFQPKDETKLARQARAVRLREELGLTFKAMGLRLNGVCASRARVIYFKGKRDQETI